jgi:hypothetical protein
LKQHATGGTSLLFISSDPVGSIFNMGQLCNLQLHFSKGSSGLCPGNAEPTTHIPRYQPLPAVGRIQLAPLVTEILAVDEINMAIERMRSSAIVGRCLIDMERGAWILGGQSALGRAVGAALQDAGPGAAGAQPQRRRAGPGRLMRRGSTRPSRSGTTGSRPGRCS